MHSNFNDLKNEHMTAQEFILKDDIENNHNYSGHPKDRYYYSESDMAIFAERYHQAKLKLLGIADVVGRSEQLKAFADYAQKRVWEDGDKDLSEFVDEFLRL